MEHYQATCTPEGSVSKGCRNTPFTPVDHRSNIMLHEEDNLPAELCEICVHGLKVSLLIIRVYSLLILPSIYTICTYVYICFCLL